MLPKEAINEFLDIYKKRHKVSLSYTDAEIKANDFIQLMDLISTNQPQLVKSLQNTK